MENIGTITFTSFQEAYDKKDEIKEKYAKLNLDAKEVYKWYFYHQLCLMTNKKMCLKDCLWSYIVGKDNIEEKLEEEYGKFYKKVTKMKEKYEKNPIEQENKTFFEILSLWFDLICNSVIYLL